MRYNLAGGTTSKDYNKLFDLVDKGYDVPVLVYSNSSNMHNIAMARRNKNLDICLSSRGVEYNSIFIDETYSNEEKRKQDFIEMCIKSDVYFFNCQ